MTQSYYTYSFTYNTDSPPHLTSIANTIGTGEDYSFAYSTPQTLYSPFGPQSFGSVETLNQATISNIGTYYQFTYDASGEMTRAWLPYRGYLGYDYTTTTYSSGNSYREVAHRYLSKDGGTPTTYPFSHEPSPGPDVHQYTVLDDPGQVGEKYWTFATSGAYEGLATQYQGRQLPGPATLLQNDFTWSQDSAGNSYISSTLTTADPGQSYQAQKKTNQTLDNHGNVTQVAYYNWNSLATPFRTDNFTYLTSSPYTLLYIYNRLASSPTTTIQYDQGSLTNVLGMREWDSSVQNVTARGNPTTVSGPSGTTSIAYTVAGATIGVTANGVGASVSANSTTNYAAPSQMTVGSLTETMSYSAFLGLTNQTAPNNATTSVGYDTSGRPTSATSPSGATTTTTYNDTATPPTIVSTVNGRWTQQTLDGLGRVVLTSTGYGTTTVSQAETVYDSCGCSPLGKMTQQAVPHAPGTAAYTTYTYDGVGRTIRVVAPDGASTTTYLYQGNTVTVTDPAGKWKKFTTDALGNLTQVNEPNPGSGGVAWYNSSWTHRKQITIDHTKVSGSASLSNFPVLISLASDSNLAAAAQSNGNDILFTAFDGVTKLNHEIELYTSATGQLIASVQIPSLSNAADTTLFMYYGNPSAGSQQNASAVWDANYQLVYHLADNAASTTVKDSTNQLNGTAQANTSAKHASGKIDGALTFNGTSDYVQASASKAPPDRVTLEVWYDPNATSACRAFGLGGTEMRLELNSTAGGAIRFYRTWGGPISWLTSSSALTPAGSWTHVALTYDDSSASNVPSLYINGVGQAFGSASPTGSPNDTAGLWQVGAAGGGGLCNGVLDEVRISNIVRSPDWIKTEYNNQSSPGTFYSLGSEQTGGSGLSDYVTTYSYDILGHVTGVSMPRSSGTQTRSFSYTGSLLMSATNPENGTVTYTYNGYNKVATRVDAKGQKVAYTYDSYARLTKVQRYPNGSTEDTCQQENYYYDSNPFDGSYSQNISGRLAAVQYFGGNAPCDTTLTEMYSYNSAGAQVGKRLRVTRSGLTNLDLNGTFAYDNEGRMTGEQYPQGGPSLTYGFDTMGRLNSLSDGTTVIGSASYGAAGQLLSLSGGSWGTETRTYNGMLQLTQLTSPGWNIQYNYSATQNNGKIVSQTDVISGEQVNYAYDSLNRLAEAVTADNPSVAQWGQSFTFDGFGNLSNVSVIKGSAPIYTASYNAATNQQTADCADANGNIFGLASCAGTGAYAYDVENRITAPANAGGMRYSYAPDNKRVWKGGNGSTDEVTYWGVTGQRLGTYQLSVNSGQLICSQTGVEYYFGSKLIKNASGFVYQDRLGSTVKTYPYGTERPSATGNGKEKFTGYFRDAETGNDYAITRYEQPGMGRFLTVDSFGASAMVRSPGSWNRYAYTGGDPINRTDPNGTDWIYGYQGWCDTEDPDGWCYGNVYSFCGALADAGSEFGGECEDTDGGGDEESGDSGLSAPDPDSGIDPIGDDPSSSLPFDAGSGTLTLPGTIIGVCTVASWLCDAAATVPPIGIPVLIGVVIGASIPASPQAPARSQTLGGEPRPSGDGPCQEQYKADIEVCKQLRSRACYAQAAERYAACLVGKPLPPFPFQSPSQPSSPLPRRSPGLGRRP